MKKLKYVLIIMVLGAIIFFATCIRYQRERITKLENNIRLLKEECVPIRFKLLDRSSDSLLVAVKFYDGDNNEIVRREFSLYGKELSFDFYVAEFGERYICFPVKMFTDMIAADDGIVLTDLYDKGGMPYIYYYKGISQELMEGLSELFENVKSGDALEDQDGFGSMVHDVDGVKLFNVGVVYKIVLHTKGGIEIMEN